MSLTGFNKSAIFFEHVATTVSAIPPSSVLSALDNTTQDGLTRRNWLAASNPTILVHEGNMFYDRSVSQYRFCGGILANDSR